MTAPTDTPPPTGDPLPTSPWSQRLAAWRRLPAWARWALSAALGILLLTLVQEFGTDDTSALTSQSTSQAMVRWAVPILLAGLGGLFAERAGVVNIGLEGMMILGTWFGAWGAINWGPWGGIIAGLVGGALGGLVHAVATVSFGVDHIISGVAINIVAPGLTRYLSDEIFTGYDGGSITQSPRAESLGRFTMPVTSGGPIGSWDSPDVLGWFVRQEWFFISDVASVLKGLTTQVSYFTIIALLLVPFSAWLLWRTRVGLRIRIAGERPEAGESLGVDIYKHKYIGVIVSGALAGMAGAFIVMELTGFYREDQTTGRGFIGLAALIFGNWRPGGVLLGALVFGYPFGLSLRDLDGSGTHALLLVVAISLGLVVLWALSRRNRVDAILAGIFGGLALLWYLLSDTAPDWLPNTMPFVLVLLVLLFASQRLRMPQADGQIYRRGET
ncbi:MAG: ABC transporter permease [Actinomycetota bacterium]